MFPIKTFIIIINSGEWDELAPDVISGITMFSFSEKLCEQAIVCLKIVAECKEDVLLEIVAIQDTQDRVFVSETKRDI